MTLLEVTMRTLRDHQVSHLVSVANLENFELYKAFQDDPKLSVIDACREGEAVAIASGLILGGKRVCLSMENFGVFESLDTFRALPCDLKLGLPVFVGFTGRDGTEETLEPSFGGMASQVARAGRWTEPILQAAGFRYERLLPDATAEAVATVVTEALSASEPVALLVDTFGGN